MLSLLKASHVVLEPFPAGGFYPSLMALALGVPVVTWPSTFLAGRTTYALYRMIGFGEPGELLGEDGAIACSTTLFGAARSNDLGSALDELPPRCCCVAPSASAYVQLAVKLANGAEWRREVSELIMQRRDRLFEQDNAIAEWEALLSSVLAKERRLELAMSG